MGFINLKIVFNYYLVTYFSAWQTRKATPILNFHNLVTELNSKITRNKKHFFVCSFSVSMTWGKQVQEKRA